MAAIIMEDDTTKNTKNGFCSKHFKLAVKVLIGILAVAIISTVVIKYKIRRKEHIEVIIQTQNGTLEIPQGAQGYQHSQARSQKLLLDYQPWKNIQLPTNIIPRTYNLNLSVDMKNDVYSGLVTITIDIINPTLFILLHNVGLTLTSINITNENHQNEVISKQWEEKTNEYYVIKMAHTLTISKTYKMYVAFNGTIRKDLNGFFTSKRGSSKIAGTFFSPISARTAFPCFDEPNFKAKFILTISHSSTYNSLSNMGVNSTMIVGNLRRTTFNQTLVMSTYIVAWVIHDDTYQYIETKAKSGLVIRAWYFQDELKDLWYGLNSTTKLLEYYEDFFDAPFPLKKLDVTVQPSFIAGAMENWGLMTFRVGRYVLSNKSSPSKRKYGYTLIAHEMVHQWFGNLATMKFWNEAWLKEGFANYIGYYGGQKVDPSMKITETIFQTLMSESLKLDSYDSSHAITPKVNTTSGIREIFDTITYNKGSCMVQMLQIFMGENDFKRGLQNFIKKYKYSNANQDDLWKVLSEVSGKDIKSFMDGWTLRMGYPVITAERINSTHVKVTQNKFTLDPFNRATVKSGTQQYLWQVLINYRSFTGTTSGSHLLTGKEAVFKIPVNSILNPNHALYYRIQYGPAMIDEIIETLKRNNTNLTVIDRTGLISDQLNMMAAKRLKLADAMKFLQYLKNEKSKEPWKETIEHFMMIYDILDDMSAKYMWGSMLKNEIIGPALTSFPGSFESEACELNLSNVISKAKQQTANSSEKLSECNLLCCAIANDDTNALWERAHIEYLNTKNVAMLPKLSCTKDTKNIERVLNYTMKDVSIDDAPFTIKNIASKSQASRDTTWKFVKSRWNELFSRYNDDIFMLKVIITGVIPLFSSKDKLRDVETFFNQKLLGSGNQAVAQSISKIKMKISYKSYMASEIKKNTLRKALRKVLS